MLLDSATLDRRRSALLIAGALIFNYIVASENIPSAVSSALTGLDVSPLVFLLLSTCCS